MNVLVLLRSLLSYFIVALCCCIVIIPCFIIACLPAGWRYDSWLYYSLVNALYYCVCWATFVPITIKGKNNIPQQSAIFIANHQSALDIPFLGTIVKGQPHIWLFLATIANIPLFGFIARRMNVVIDPSRLRKMVESINVSLFLVENKKRHCMIFPEGGRYIDSCMHRFYPGFAIIAQKSGRPVVPVFLKNLNRVYPPHSFLVHYYPVEIIIGKPFVYKPGETQELFIERVYAWFVEHCTE